MLRDFKLLLNKKNFASIYVFQTLKCMKIPDNELTKKQKFQFNFKKFIPKTTFYSKLKKL